MESALRFVSDRDDARGLTLASRRELPSDSRPMAVLPAALHERATDVAVARLRDPTSLRAVAARMDRGHEPEIGSEVAWRFEAFDAVELCDEIIAIVVSIPRKQRSAATCLR